MPSYNKKDYKESNVNYLNKDFASFKKVLIDYARSYFPDSYRDFNESSPGMMLIEMGAYVGDVLSFYIDQQYKEMMLPLAEERRNIVNMGKMLGYKARPTVPAYVDLTFYQTVNSMTGDESRVDYSNAGYFDKGMVVTSTSDNTIKFQTLEEVDFTITGSTDSDHIAGTDDVSGLVDSYKLSRTVKAIAAETKTQQFTVTTPTKFLKLTLSQDNVIDIVSVFDSNGNRWYEVEYLAQYKVPIEKHYTADDRVDENGNSSAYYNIGGPSDGINNVLAVPYSLEYIKTEKRFMTEVDEDNKTSLVFGNGVLRNGVTVEDGFLDLEQAGISIPGQTADIQSYINPMLGDEYSTLGETPNQTRLIITYRVGGGIKSNVPAGDLTNLETALTLSGTGNSNIDSVINVRPAVGGKDNESLEEIRQRAISHFTTQNRAVTKEDYEARIMNMSSKFGNVAKVLVMREDLSSYAGQTVDSDISMLPYFDFTGEGNISTADITYINNAINESIASGNRTGELETAVAKIESGIGQFNGNGSLTVQINTEENPGLGTIKAYVLSYNHNKNLFGNPQSTHENINDNSGIPTLLYDNMKNYLENYKLLTDLIVCQDGYIINFGVIFDIVAHKFANKAEVKLRCIEKIKDYFNIDKMKFNQPIYLNQLEYELMGVDGVRHINYLCITQNEVYDKGGNIIPDVQTFPSPGLYKYSIDASSASDTYQQPIDGGLQGYGWKYDFRQAMIDGIIAPSADPAVFELKNPNENIKGRVS